MRAARPASSCLLLIGTVLLGAGAGGAGASDRALQLAMRGAVEYQSECALESGTGRRVLQGEHVDVNVRAVGAARAHRLRIVTDRCVRDTGRPDAPPTSSWVRHGSRRIDLRRRYRLDTTRGGEYRFRAVGRSRDGEPLRSDPVYLWVQYPTTLTARVGGADPQPYVTYSLLTPVWVSPGATYIEGRVISSQPECVDDRRLSVYMARSRSPLAQQIAEGRSYSDGSYLIPIAQPRAATEEEYYVEATMRDTCYFGKSPVVSGR